VVQLRKNFPRQSTN